ncbi:SsrA-binding protein SmpB [Dongia rigui]|uniref:SsrA-binding protein n=1 Tax=Dongia rigui TaxID=940149 RepID=A0ABU5DYX0_9PROT|nr:SsrA-binding protein SmpB [Dongia rigui]MDY0872532.1 SsrA-binding protein SmpB [Dongia rigui]
MARDISTNRFAAQNRKARHDYSINDTIEAGLQLMGSEVKSLRLGRCSINEAFAAERDGEFWLINAHFPEYDAANRFNHEPGRPRKLLLKKRQVVKLINATQRDGVTVVPLAIYFNDRGRAKCELGVAKGRRQADKRAAIKDRDWKRDQARIVRNRGGD